MNTVKTKWIRDVIKVTKSDFVSIQEHFKKTKTIDKFFIDQFPDNSSFVVPGYRDIGQDCGRPKGGIAMLSSKRINVNKKRIKTESFRIQAQVMKFTRTNILWINCYMPTDPQTIQYDNQELLTVLSEVEKIMDTAEYDDVVWMGDFNWDKTRNSGFAETMDNFVNRLGL